MTDPFENPPSWNTFEERVKDAIEQAAQEHNTVGSLVSDLWACEAVLRSHGDATERLRELDTAAANEIAGALEAHRDQDDVQYGSVCAANVVIASMNAILNAAAVGIP
jgi:hypothetical protein